TRENAIDLLRQMTQLLFSGRAAGLRLRVVVARFRVREIDRVQPIARPAVRFEAPERRRPDRRVVAVAVHEDDRRSAIAAGNDRCTTAEYDEHTERGCGPPP